MDEKGYREVVVVDPGVELLYPIFTRTVDELVAERQKLEMVPDFWLKHAKKYPRLNHRRLNPDVMMLIGVLWLHLWLAGCVYASDRSPLACWLMAATYLGVILMPPVAIVIHQAVRRKNGNRWEPLKADLRWCAIHLVPVLGVWYCSKEAIAAFIRWRRLKAPRSMSETRARFFAATHADLIDTLKRRLEHVTKSRGNTNQYDAYIVSAEARIRGCERCFEDWKAAESDTCGCPDPSAPAREALQRAYLLARQAVEAAERGPTYVLIDTAVAPPGAHDHSPLAFAKTLVPGRHRAKRST